MNQSKRLLLGLLILGVLVLITVYVGVAFGGGSAIGFVVTALIVICAVAAVAGYLQN